MGLGNELTPAKRNQLIGAHLNGVTLKAAAEQLDINYNTAKYTWQARNRRPLGQLSCNRSGGPRKTTQADDNRLYRHLRRQPTLKWREIAEITPLKRTQTRRRMTEIAPDFHQYISKWRPHLTEATMLKRLLYSQEMHTFGWRLWRRTWFTDECSIALDDGRQREWVWRHSGEAILPQFISERSPNHDTVMIWAAMRRDGTIIWCFVDDYYDNDRTFTSAGYRRMLRDLLPQFYEAGDPFLQDNARPHTAFATRGLLEELGVWCLGHPPCSPDLNAIEHLWFALKREVDRLYPELWLAPGNHTTKREALKHAVRHAFELLLGNPEWDLPARLVDSMGRRLRAVELAQGKWTKY